MASQVGSTARGERSAVARWWPAAVLCLGLVVAALGVASYLHVVNPQNPLVGAANSTIDCGNAYSRGSIKGSPCRELLDDTARNGAVGVSLGAVLILVGVGAIVKRVGLRRGWPFLAIGLGLVTTGGFFWLLWLQLDGGRCGNIYITENAPTPGEPCFDARETARWTANVLMFAGPLLLLAGTVEVLRRAVQTLLRR
jgi:hypothetical protein